MSVKSLFRFPGFPGRNRKGSKRTFVLREGKEEGSDVDHLNEEKNSLGYKFYNKQGREAKEEGEGREGEVVFHVREDGVSWLNKNIIICQEGSSAYIVYIQGKEGREEDTIECKVPHLWAMLDLVSLLNEGKRPLFTSFAAHKPTGTV